MRFLEPGAAAVSDTVVVSDEEGADQSALSQTMGWDGDGLGVLWSKLDYEVRFRRVGARGELASPSRRAFGYPLLVFLGPLIPSAGGFAVALSEGQRYLSIYWLSSSGAMLRRREVQQPIKDDSVKVSSWAKCRPASLLTRPGGYAVAWTMRWRNDPTPQDRVNVALLDALASDFADPLTPFESEEVTGASMAATDGGWVLSANGIVTIGLDSDGTVHEPVKLATDDRPTDPLIVTVPGGVVLAASADRPNSEAGNALCFLAADPATGQVHSRRHLNTASPPECYVEAKDLARAGSSLRFGIVWVEKCGDERRMYFADVGESR